MKHLKYYALLGLSLALISLTGCAENEARAESQKQSKPMSAKGHAATALQSQEENVSPKPTNVKTEKLETTTLTEYIVAYGTTQAVRDVTYSAEVPGRIEALRVDIGDRIRKGRIIARIDFGTLKAQAEQAVTAYDLAKSTYERLASLEGEGVISSQQIDEAKSSMLSAKAGVSIAEQNVKKAVVRSTYSGIVGAKFVEKGEYVAPGTPLVKVVDYKTIVVEAKLAETQAASIGRNADVTVDIEALHKSFKGKVETLIPTADRDSKTFTLRIEIENPNYEILVGMSAVVRLTAVTHDNVIVVSQSTVLEERNGRSVYVVEDGVARKRKVTLGASQEDKVVLAAGVSPGESVVVVGQRDLEDGKPIHAIN
jgi:membrane fusion protein, multidrug efflux system